MKKHILSISISIILGVLIFAYGTLQFIRIAYNLYGGGGVALLAVIALVVGCWGFYVIRIDNKKDGDTK